MSRRGTSATASLSVLQELCHPLTSLIKGRVFSPVRAAASHLKNGIHQASQNTTFRHFPDSQRAHTSSSRGPSVALIFRSMATWRAQDLTVQRWLTSLGPLCVWLTSLGPVCVWLRLVSDTFVGLNWPSGNIHTTKKGYKSGCPGPGLFCLPIARQSQPSPAGLLPPVCPENASGSADLLDLGLGKAQMKRKILVWQLPRWPWDQRSFPWDVL